MRFLKRLIRDCVNEMKTNPAYRAQMICSMVSFIVSVVAFIIVTTL